jgi:hypothetical protein
MTDLPERAAAARTSLAGLIRLAPAAELATTSRRRRRHRATAIAAVVAAAVVVVPALPRSAPPVITQPPYAIDQTITVDGGTLLLTPPDPSDRPAIPVERATQALPRLVLTELAQTYDEIYLATVASPLSDPFTGTPLHRRLVWVLTTAGNGRPRSCPAIRAESSLPTGGATSMNALVMDAETGETLVYAHSPCFSGPPKMLVKAYTAYSVPFELREDGTILAQLPPCGESMLIEHTGSASGPQLRVLARIPVAPCTSPTPSPSSYRGVGVRPPARHAPVGPVIQVDGALVAAPTPS